MKTLSKIKLANLKKFAIFSAMILVGFILGINKNKLTDKIISSLSITSYKVLAAETISATKLQEELGNKDFTFINVHTPYEGEIKQTDLFIEYDYIMANKDKLPKDKNTPIVLYCRSGNMSAQALSTLKNMGYVNVSHLKGGMKVWQRTGYELLDLSQLPSKVIPEDGISLPISWSDVGPRLLEFGVIDLNKLEKVMELTDEQKEILTKGSDTPIKITSENSRFVVNMLWALGLAQKSLVFDEGPMGKEYKGEAANFASTGGWTLARSDALGYLNKFDLIPLNTEQQEKVAEIAKNVYRPCCGNPTWFPDCNHGMAALAAIELLVSADVPEEEIYKYVLGLNSFWFSDTYLTIATYFARQGTSWDDVNAKMVLGQDFSSGQGAREISAKVGPLPYGGQAGGSCGA